MEGWLSQWQKLKSRGEIKRAAKEIEKNPELRKILLVALEEEELSFSTTWSAKKLLRVFLDRADDAQKRTNPIHRNEPFSCLYCQQEVPYCSAKIRDHCPFCLRSVHVDVTPGDRAANCGGILAPKSFFLTGADLYIEYTCTECEYLYRIRAHPEDQIPHSLSVKDIP